MKKAVRKRINQVLVGLAVLILVFFSIAIIQSSISKKKVRWEPPRYRTFGKEPYDLFVLSDQLENLFPSGEVRRFNSDDLGAYWVPEYEYETTPSLYKMEEDQLESFSFVGVSSDFDINYQDAKGLLLHIFQGNDALVASEGAFSELTRLTGIEIRNHTPVDTSFSKNKKRFRLQIKDESFELNAYDHYAYIASYPDDSTEVIATNQEGEIIGIRMAVGEGHLTYFTMPVVFTNYYMLHENDRISEQLLISLPDGDVRWGPRFYGSGRQKYGSGRQESKSLLSFIMDNPSLKWAFYTLLFSLIVFLRSR